MSSRLAVYPVPNQSAREAWYCRQMCWLDHVTSSPSIVDQKSDSKLFGAIPILVAVTQKNLVQYQPVPCWFHSIPQRGIVPWTISSHLQNWLSLKMGKWL